MAATVKTISERLTALQRSTNDLKKMGKNEFSEYANDLQDLVTDMGVSSTTVEFPSPDIQSLQTQANVLTDRVDSEKFRRSWRGFLGLEKKSPLAKGEAEQKTTAPTPQEELDKFNKEVDRIKQERLKTSIANMQPDSKANDSRSIIASSVDEFRHALTPPLLDEDVVELQEKRDALDKAQAVGNLYHLGGNNIRAVLDKMKRVATGAASVLGEFAEETTGGTMKAAALFLAWPLILPVKVANQACSAAKYACCAVDGVLGFIDKGLDLLIGNMERTEAGKFVLNTENVIKGTAHVVLRSLPVAFRAASQAAAIGCRWLEKHIDADRWLKKSPVTGGFAVGSVGAAILITVTIASVFSFGIPLAMLGLGFAVATIGALAQGYFKGKAKAEELATLKLNPSDTAKLDKHEYEHQHQQKPTVAEAKTPAVAATAAIITEQAQEAAAKKPTVNVDKLMETRQTFTPQQHTVHGSDQNARAAVVESDKRHTMD